MEAAVTPRAELSSIVTALEDLIGRVSGIAERTQNTEREWLATELFEAERALEEGRRRLSKTVERLR